MARSIAYNAIALLIEMAEQGELDPWDVQVIDVIDRVLLQIRSWAVPVVEGRSPYEADLSESGQALLYAAMLVLLKADSLARLSAAEEVEEDDSGDMLELGDDLEVPPLPSRLERQLRRRASATPPQQRRVTLQDLIAQLEVMAEAMADPRPRRRAHRPRPQAHSKAIKTIAQLAHHENLSEIAAALEQFLTQYWPQLSETDDWIEFEHLLDYWMDPPAHGLDGFVKPESGSEAHSEQGDRVGVFWALLYLSAQSKVELAQEDFYQALHLRSLDAEALTASDLSELSAVVLPD
jgi:segregation and condensation protein A